MPVCIKLLSYLSEEISLLKIPQQKRKDKMEKRPICTHLSNIGIFIYHLSEGKADAGSVKRIVQTISHAIAGIKKRF